MIAPSCYVVQAGELTGAFGQVGQFVALLVGVILFLSVDGFWQIERAYRAIRRWWRRRQVRRG